MKPFVIWIVLFIVYFSLCIPWSFSNPASAKAIKPATQTIPPARSHYMGRKIARTMHYSGAEWLIRETRENEEATSKLLDELDIKPGQMIADIGCGIGYYSIPLAKRVGEKGQVFAVDIQQEMLNGLKQRALKAAVSNINFILGNAIDPKLPEGKIDLVLLVDVYHEFSHPEYMLKAIRDSLKPHGRVALVEYRAEDPDVPIKELHKMSKSQILKEWLHNSFRLVEEYDQLPWQHLMFFKRQEKP